MNFVNVTFVGVNLKKGSRWYSDYLWILFSSNSFWILFCLKSFVFSKHRKLENSAYIWFIFPNIYSIFVNAFFTFAEREVLWISFNNSISISEEIRTSTWVIWVISWQADGSRENFFYQLLGKCWFYLFSLRFPKTYF